MAEIREQIVKAMPIAYCDTCYLHKPGTYSRKDCITYGKRLCALEEIYVDQILAIKELARGLELYEEEEKWKQ